MAVIDEKLNRDAYSAAAEMAKNGVGAQPTYAGSYDQQIADLYDRIQNREKFNFDLDGNALYQTYKDKAIQGGKLAMRDTMGRAAALTGGYGSSYGQAVGQQAYDAQLQKLNDVIPELYQQAYQQYRDEGTDLQQQYAMAGKLAADEYAKHRDAVSDWQYERAFQQQREDTAYSRQKAEESEAYSRQQDAYKQLYQMIAATGYQPTEAELKTAGMSGAAAKALRSAWEKANEGAGGSSGGSPGSKSPKSENPKSERMSASEYGYMYGSLGASYAEVMNGLREAGYSDAEIRAASTDLRKSDIDWARNAAAGSTKKSDAGVVKPSKATAGTSRSTR